MAEVSLKGIRQKLLLGASLALLPWTSAWADTLIDALTKAYAGNPNLAAEQANLRVRRYGGRNIPYATAAE